jgi:hypothetical protein
MLLQVMDYNISWFFLLPHVVPPGILWHCVDQHAMNNWSTAGWIGMNLVTEEFGRNCEPFQF